MLPNRDYAAALIDPSYRDDNRNEVRAEHGRTARTDGGIERSETMKPLIGIPAHTRTIDGSTWYGVRESYCAAIRAHGGIPVAIPPVVTLVDDYVEHFAGLLIPGGTDIDPAHYGEVPHSTLLPVDENLDQTELALIRRAHDRDRPMLAICRGIQSLAVAMGGSLIQDLPAEHTGVRHEVRENGRQFLAHDIQIDPSSRLAALLESERVAVNTLHHQAVKTLPQGLIATAWAHDGIVEAAEAPDRRFVVAVQCHPEELWNSTAPEFSGLFSAFIEACRFVTSANV